MISPSFALLLLISSAQDPAAAASVDFGDQVRPILVDKCFLCHGPDRGTRRAGLRLDREELARASGVLDMPDAELIERILSDDPEYRMPPPESALELSSAERETLAAWVRGGAEYEAHWAFEELPQEITVPVVDGDWARGPLDQFVQQGLAEEGLSPAPAAAPERWLRRVSLDLTGLPPSLEELDRLLARPGEASRAAVVERLLASPAFGERMAIPWLDVARYADSYGYQSDRLSPTWPFRDWVVRAFNKDLPYDEFLVQQLAGDLLPNAGTEERLATAFNRLHRMTNEGGSIEAEWRNEYVADRVHTLGTAMLGLTLECARCHDHKFDPITQRNYYELYAYFNNLDEAGMYNNSSRVPTPSLLLPTAKQAAAIERMQAGLKRQLDEEDLAKDDARFEAWLVALFVRNDLPGAVGSYSLKKVGEGGVPGWSANAGDPGSTPPSNLIGELHGLTGLKFGGDEAVHLPKLCGGFNPDQAFTIEFSIALPDDLNDAVILHNTSGTDVGYHGMDLMLVDGRLVFAFKRFWPGNALAVRSKPVPRGRSFQVTLTYDGLFDARGMRIYVDGVRQEEVLRNSLTKLPRQGGDGLSLGARFRSPGLKGGVLASLCVFDREVSPLEAESFYFLGKMKFSEDREALRAVFDLGVSKLRMQARLGESKRLNELFTYQTGIMEVPVMEEFEPRRPTHLLDRGDYDAACSDADLVQARTPGFLPPMEAGQPANRLGLARWLTDPDHPLAARVAVNRLWPVFFDNGLVETADDFGMQGSVPSHPELLDWLARHFVEGGWDVKALCREIVLSATYAQDSAAGPEARELDPGNRLLSRGPSERLSAEMLRDTALFAAGLLDRRTGGAPVSPYQPAGLWRESNGMSPAYQQSVGIDLYRRSLYTVWKRTAPMPSMLVFDSPTREVSCAQRQTTSTPLQALVLLNGIQYVEAARVLAQRDLLLGGEASASITRMFRRLTGRHPNAEEAPVLLRLYIQQLAGYREHPEQALALLAIGEAAPHDSLEPAALAAMTVVAQTILNLDVTVWKR